MILKQIKQINFIWQSWIGGWKEIEKWWKIDYSYRQWWWWCLKFFSSIKNEKWFFSQSIILINIWFRFSSFDFWFWLFVCYNLVFPWKNTLIPLGKMNFFLVCLPNDNNFKYELPPPLKNICLQVKKTTTIFFDIFDLPFSLTVWKRWQKKNKTI